MSADTIPAELVDILRGEIGAAMDVTEDGTAMSDPNFEPAVEDVVQAVIRVLTDRATRPAEPAAPVAEAGDGEVALKSLLAAIQLGHAAYDADESSSDLSAFREAYGAHNAIEQLLANLRSTLEAERARADELRRLLTASGRCVDDLTARLDAFEHAQEKARDEGFDHALKILESALGSPTYYAADGSETWEGDTRGTIYNLLRASGVWRGDDDMLVTKDRDFWKERFQVESRSRIEAEQRAAEALARAEKAEGAGADDRRRLDWLETNRNAEISHESFEDDVWQIHFVNGNRNDREWTKRAEADTVRDAIDAAIRSAPPRDLSQGGQHG